MTNHPNRGHLTVDINGKWRLYTDSLPVGWTPLGTVTRDAYGTGALVRIESSGLYVQINAGTVRSLDQRKVLAALNNT